MATELLYFFKVNQFLRSLFQEHNTEKTLSKMIMSRGELYCCPTAADFHNDYVVTGSILVDR